MNTAEPRGEVTEARLVYVTLFNYGFNGGKTALQKNLEVTPKPGASPILYKLTLSRAFISGFFKNTFPAHKDEFDPFLALLSCVCKRA